jgi:hypothetical protein
MTWVYNEEYGGELPVIERDTPDWADRGYHEIKTQTVDGKVYSIGKLGSMECLLDEELNPVTGWAFHNIDLASCTVELGDQSFTFREHLGDYTMYGRSPYYKVNKQVRGEFTKDGISNTIALLGILILIALFLSPCIN